LATESIIFDHAYATTPVCGPSRSAIITGMLPTSIGTMHMRTANDVQGWGKQKYEDQVFDHLGNQVFDLMGQPLRKYAAVIPPEVKCFTEYLRAEGYFCTNNAKRLSFAAPQSAWDENGSIAH
jgi:N-sulfoglucosamine sulfohydrolase